MMLKRVLLSVVLALAFFSSPIPASCQEPVLASNELKKLSIEELMNVEVTSVSMRPEKITEVASAIQVLSKEEVRRSGVSRLPEAFALFSNLQVAQVNSHDWAITARGFNGLPSLGGIFANKLLVMVDGRSIYNPLLGGVYWDVQNVFLEDLDRIEVVSGPGGTLWGANAVNGVINVVSKSARETQGWYASGGGGSFLQDFGQLRYGFQVDSVAFFRVYGQRFDQKHAERADGTSALDKWGMTQSGFRMDYHPSKSNSLTVQADFYGGNQNDATTRAITDGQNALARFAHSFGPESNLSVQTYFDRTWRATPNSSNKFYELATYDLEVQHRFPMGSRQSILWGGGYRMQKDRIASVLSPLSRTMPLYSAFIQDEIDIVGDFLNLTIGSKFLHNVFSGFETQPCIRLAASTNERHTVWASVSRAVRTPTRFDSDFTPTLAKFDSEKVTAYEAGYRVKPSESLSLSFAAFFNRYNQLRSLDSASGSPSGIAVANSQGAESHGAEISANYHPAIWWHLRGGYTYFNKSIWANSPRVSPLSEDFEGVDPRHVAIVQSMMDLPGDVQADFFARYVSGLTTVLTSIPGVPAYFDFDARVARRFGRFEVSVIGQNLGMKRHTEVGSSRIPRCVYGKLVWVL